MRFRLSRAPVMLAACAFVACGGGQKSLVQTAPAPQVEFESSLARAGDEVAAGRYDVADKLLTDYATRFPVSMSAIDALYWRALYKLDPANSASSAHEAAALLDSYLATPGVQRKAEATTLRRLASAIEQRVAIVPAPTQSQKPEPSSADRAKDEEVARLKDELSKANAELERIKRRLSKP